MPPAWEELMRAGWIAPTILGLALTGCGGPGETPAQSATGALEGDAALISAAQTISDQIGGCSRPHGYGYERESWS